MAFFMQALDATILNTALPVIAGDLRQSALEMQMAVISYALTLALFIPLSGWLADRYGTLRVFRFSLALFVMGSVACAFSQSLTQLVAARVLQGLGGSLMMPVSRLAIIRTVPKQQLLPVWNLMAMAGLTGPVLGPVLGGWLVTYASWHWIFLINIPIGLAGILLARRHMPDVFGQCRKLDIPGFILFGCGLVGLTLGLDLLAEGFVAKAMAMLILSCGLLFLYLYYRHAKGSDNALVPLSLFHIRTFRLGTAANLIFRISASGIPFLLPLMLQVGFGYSAAAAGWMIAPIAVSSLLTKPLIARVLDRFGYKGTLIAASIIMIASVSSMALLRADTPLWLNILVVACYGACISVMFTAVNTLTVSDLDEQHASAGSTMLSVAQQVGIGLGIAVAAVILNLYRTLLADGAEGLTRAFSYTFITAAGLGLLLIFVLAKLRRTDGRSLQNRQPKLKS